MAKRKKCVGAKVITGRTAKGKKRWKAMDSYGKLKGFREGEQYVMVFDIQDLLTDEVTQTEEMIVVYDEKRKTFINVSLHVQVSKSTIDKGNYTKLSGNGNEPKLRLTHKEK